MPLLRKTFRNLTSRLRLGLFGRTFLLLAALMLVSLGAWLQVFFSMELGPRANQMAQRVITAVNITRTALIYSHDGERSKLLLDRPPMKASRSIRARSPTMPRPCPTTTTGNAWRSTSARASVPRPRSPGA